MFGGGSSNGIFELDLSNIRVPLKREDKDYIIGPCESNLLCHALDNYRNKKCDNEDSDMTDGVESSEED